MISNTHPEEQGNSNLNELKTKLSSIIGTIVLNPTSHHQLAPQTLQAIAQQLNDIRPLLQFEQMQAENARDWDRVDAADEAIATCEDALDSVNAAILRAIVIGLNPQDLAEMQQIRKQIQSAIKTQQVIQVFVRLAGFFRRLVL